jgi:hypothetical protein
MESARLQDGSVGATFAVVQQKSSAPQRHVIQLSRLNSLLIGSSIATQISNLTLSAAPSARHRWGV